MQLNCNTVFLAAYPPAVSGVWRFPYGIKALREGSQAPAGGAPRPGAVRCLPLPAAAGSGAAGRTEHPHGRGQAPASESRLTHPRRAPQRARCALNLSPVSRVLRLLWLYLTSAGSSGEKQRMNWTLFGQQPPRCASPLLLQPLSHLRNY